ncbi:MAG: hypothetical protein QOJ69_304, partial [Actinomycetota bacterium]|nr:hypothetical protein [Actinomycetota bacterium]
MYSALKRLLVGRPIATTEGEHRRLPKTVALATYSSDAISSTAYATEEILIVLTAGGASLAVGLSKLVPISIVVAVLIFIVVSSYRQTIFAYPQGGGSYLVSRDNLGKYPSLVAGASLLVDYILTVAVSISAGVAAIISLPAFRGLSQHRVAVGLGLIVLITVLNLRGLKESGSLFAVPAYTYILSLALLITYGLARTYFGHLDPIPPPRPGELHGLVIGGNLTLLLLLKGFSSGAVALSGIEAIADGVPNFKPKPSEAKNAADTLAIMGAILATLFVGVSVLAHHLEPFPNEHETVISQMGHAVYGGGPFYVILQFATAAILTLAANTAFADFPRLSSIIARDGYLPRQFMSMGDRLVFSNGVVFLAIAAGGLLTAFGGITNALIPLYAVGVFTSFTLSQTGMVKRHLNLRESGWQRGIAINGLGAVATGIVLIVVAASKFTSGAWLPIIVIPAVIALFVAIRRHYDRVGSVLAITPAEVRPQTMNHTVIVLVGRIHKGVLKALAYSRSLRPQHLVALYVSFEEEDQLAMEKQWRDFKIDVPLEIKYSRYRELVRPVIEYIDEVDSRWGDDT